MSQLCISLRETFPNDINTGLIVVINKSVILSFVFLFPHAFCMIGNHDYVEGGPNIKGLIFPPDFFYRDLRVRGQREAEPTVRLKGKIKKRAKIEPVLEQAALDNNGDDDYLPEDQVKASVAGIVHKEKVAEPAPGQWVNPWKKYIALKKTKAVASADTHQEFMDAVRNILNGENVQYYKKIITSCIVAGVDPQEAYDLIAQTVKQAIEANPKGGKAGRKKGPGISVGNRVRSIFLAINVGLLKSKTDPFGSCGNDTCFLAHYITALEVPANMQLDISRMQIIKAIPKLYAACNNVQAHVINGGSVGEAINEIATRVTSSEYLSEYRALGNWYKQLGD